MKHADVAHNDALTVDLGTTRVRVIILELLLVREATILVGLTDERFSSTAANEAVEFEVELARLFERGNADVLALAV